MLFIIYINDIVTDIESDILIFADDTSQLANDKTADDTRSILERDIARIESWAKKWKVCFGAGKFFQGMTFPFPPLFHFTTKT